MKTHPQSNSFWEGGFTWENEISKDWAQKIKNKEKYKKLTKIWLLTKEKYL